MKLWIGVGTGLLLLLLFGCQTSGPLATRPGILDTPAATLRAPALPEELPAPRRPGSTVNLFSVLDTTNDHLGEGTLGPADDPAEPGADWITRIALPLYRNAGGEHFGWLANGWIVQTTPLVTKRPLLTRAMVATGGQTLAFMVLEERPDGWIRFRYALPLGQEQGTAWTHSNFLHMGSTSLAVRSWDNQFLADGRGPLVYRNSSVRHALRQAPDTKGELIDWIGSLQQLEPLATEGDWMRVRVTQASVNCNPDSTIDPQAKEGWICWRSAEKGPWVWFASECP